VAVAPHPAVAMVVFPRRQVAVALLVIPEVLVVPLALASLAAPPAALAPHQRVVQGAQEELPRRP
jgi:hypothetical protein